MQAVSPVMPGENFEEIVIAKDQPEYLPLPAIDCGNGIILCRFELSEEEKHTVAETGSVWLFMHTFGKPVTPISLQVEQPKTENRQIDEIEFMCALRYTPELAELAERNNLKTLVEQCSNCHHSVLISEGTREGLEKREGVRIICMECLENYKAENPDMEFGILPETSEELKKVIGSKI